MMLEGPDGKMHQLRVLSVAPSLDAGATERGVPESQREASEPAATVA
jgi:hypothetical protein